MFLRVYTQINSSILPSFFCLSFYKVEEALKKQIFNVAFLTLVEYLILGFKFALNFPYDSITFYFL